MNILDWLPLPKKRKKPLNRRRVRMGKSQRARLGRRLKLARIPSKLDVRALRKAGQA